MEQLLVLLYLYFYFDSLSQENGDISNLTETSRGRYVLKPQPCVLKPIVWGEVTLGGVRCLGVG